MRIVEDCELDDGLTVRVAADRCDAGACRTEHSFLMLGWASEDRWCCVDSLELDGEPDIESIEVDEFDRTSLMLWSIPWRRMSHAVAVAQLSAGYFMPKDVWEELNEWPDGSLAWIFRMKGTDFYTPCALLSYTRLYRRDLGGTRGVSS